MINKIENNFRLVIFDWSDDEPESKAIYFNDLKKAIKKAKLIKLNYYQDIVIFDNQTSEELFFLEQTLKSSRKDK